MRRATGGEQLVVDDTSGRRGSEPRRDPAVLEVEQAALRDLVLAQGQPQRALDDLERGLRRGEEDLAPGAADPERAADAACEVQSARRRARRSRPSPSSRAAARAPRIGRGQLDEREDRLGVDGHLGLGAPDRVLGEDLLVVDDDPVVDPDDGAVPDRVVVREERGVALGVVAHVHQRLRRVGRGARLRRAAPSRRSAACGSTRSGRRCGRRSRPRLRRAPRCRPAAPAPPACGRRSSRCVEAVSRDSAHQRIRSPRSDIDYLTVYDRR